MNIFDITEEELSFRANTDLSHLLGSKNEDLQMLPDLSKTPLTREARRKFDEREKLALIEEDGAASNTTKLDIKGTHYESQTAGDIAMSIMPLKGL